MQKLEAFFKHYISKYPESLLQGLNFHINENIVWEHDIDDFLSAQSAITGPAPSTIDRS